MGVECGYTVMDDGEGAAEKLPVSAVGNKASEYGGEACVLPEEKRDVGDGDEGDEDERSNRSPHRSGDEDRSEPEA